MATVNLSVLFSQLASTTNLFSLKAIFLVILAVEISFRSDYVYPDNYINRSSPTYNPNPTASPVQPSSGLLGNILDSVLRILDGLLGVAEVPDNACQRSKNGSPLVFDFVIVGAGAAGSVLARRLSENPDVTVLVIEAGASEPLESVVPFFFPFAFNVTEKLWNYHADVNQNASLAFKNGCPMQFGKVLGGSTSVGAMLWICGNDRDFNHWNASGATGWDYDSVLKYFLKIENNLDPSRVGKYHATGGPLAISSNILLDPFVSIVKKGWNDLGYKNLSDYSAPNYNGVSETQSTMENGERVSAYRAYLRPVIDRPNLFFAYDAFATNIVFNGKTAVGVNVQTGISDCANIQFNARKEIILSAGTFGSTKLLLQSGVGPQDQLKKFNISLVQDLPVGKNLQDHVIGASWLTMNPRADPQTTGEVLSDALQYLLFRKGNDAQLGTSYMQAFINISDPKAMYPDIYQIPFRIRKNQAFLIDILTNFGYTDDIISKLLNINKNYELLLFFITILNPKSRGSVELRGVDPTLPPKITSGFFTDPDNYDRSTISSGILRLGELIKTDPWNTTYAEFIDFDLPLCKSIPFATRAYWDCYTKYFSACEWHFSGANSMGAASDPTAVVDPTLTVRGLNNLRVIDSGVMPSVPSGNILCPTYMVGEKGADMVKQKFNL